MLISKLKNSGPKLTCTGPGPTNTRDKVMVTGEYIGCTGTPATLDTSHHNNHYARTIIITTHITTSVSSYPLPSSAAMSWSCGVVSTRYVSWVSGQWPVSTIGRNNNFDGFPIQRHYKHTLATKYYQHTFTGDSVAKMYYHLVAQHHLPTWTNAQYMRG